MITDILDEDNILKLDPSFADWFSENPANITTSKLDFQFDFRTVSASTTPEPQDDKSLPSFADHEIDCQSWCVNENDVDELLGLDVRPEEVFTTAFQEPMLEIPDPHILVQDILAAAIEEPGAALAVVEQKKDDDDEALIGDVDMGVTAGQDEEPNEGAADIPIKASTNVVLRDQLFQILRESTDMNEDTIHSKIHAYFSDAEKFAVIEEAFASIVCNGGLILPDDLLDEATKTRQSHHVADASLLVTESHKEERGPQTCKRCGALRKGHDCPNKPKKVKAKKTRASKHSLRSGSIRSS